MPGNPTETFISNAASLYLIIAVSAATAALAVVQLFKATPRLMLLFAGAAAGMSLSLVTFSGFHGPLLLAAGLLPAVYGLIRQGMAVSAEPKRRVRSGLLIAAGVLMCVAAVYYIATAAASLSMYAAIDAPRQVVLFAAVSSAGAVACAVCLAVFCFAKSRRTSVFYRVFFTGLPASGLLIAPFSYAAQAAMGVPFLAMVLPMAAALILLVAVLFVLIQAARRRRDDAAVPPPALEPDAGVAA
jgi:hypothetical protein